MDNIGSFKKEDFPLSRIGTVDIGRIGKKRHTITALIEVDVTESRKAVRKLPDASFNSWLIKCVADCIAENKSVHSIRAGKKNLITFDDVDVSIMIERIVNGKKVPLPYVVRKADAKSVSEISREVKRGKEQDIHGMDDYVLGDQKPRFAQRLYYYLPDCIRLMIWRAIVRSPFMTKSNMGTVMITSVGIAGKFHGWVIPESVHPVAFAIGSITKKPGIVDDRIEIREFLCITARIDHDVVDGVPAMRALSRLTDMLENGHCTNMNK